MIRTKNALPHEISMYECITYDLAVFTTYINELIDHRGQIYSQLNHIYLHAVSCCAFNLFN